MWETGVLELHYFWHMEKVLIFKFVSSMYLVFWNIVLMKVMFLKFVGTSALCRKIEICKGGFFSERADAFSF